jgi:hypothetical protein
MTNCRILPLPDFHHQNGNPVGIPEPVPQFPFYLQAVRHGLNFFYKNKIILRKNSYINVYRLANFIFI